MRVLFITLEFSAGTFSGNGVLAQDQVMRCQVALCHITNELPSQVRSLTELGHQIFVISAKPQHHTSPGDSPGAHLLLEVGCPLHSCPVSCCRGRFPFRRGDDWISTVHG